MVEMALVLPILIMLVFGIIEFGRILNTYMTVTNISREGAREGAVGGTDAEIIDAVEMGASLDASLLNIEIDPISASPRSRGSSVTVVVSYDVDIIAPIIGNLIGDPYTVRAQTTMRVEG